MLEDSRTESTAPATARQAPALVSTLAHCQVGEPGSSDGGDNSDRSTFTGSTRNGKQQQILAERK